MYNWRETFGEVTHPDEQVKILKEVLLNICSNIIPNELKKIKPYQVPWITPSIKSLFRMKNRVFKSFIREGQPDNMLEDIQNMIAQGPKLVEDAKHKYVTNVGRTLSDPSTGTKKYWSMINEILNKAKIPDIPPLLEDNILVIDFASKAQIFNEYFILQ